MSVLPPGSEYAAPGEREALAAFEALLCEKLRAAGVAEPLPEHLLAAALAQLRGWESLSSREVVPAVLTYLGYAASSLEPPALSLALPKIEACLVPLLAALGADSRVAIGALNLLAGCFLVLISAGVAPRPGETRAVQLAAGFCLDLRRPVREAAWEFVEQVVAAEAAEMAEAPTAFASAALEVWVAQIAGDRPPTEICTALDLLASSRGRFDASAGGEPSAGSGGLDERGEREEQGDDQASPLGSAPASVFCLCMVAAGGGPVASARERSTPASLFLARLLQLLYEGAFAEHALPVVEGLLRVDWALAPSGVEEVMEAISSAPGGRISIHHLCRVYLDAAALYAKLASRRVEAGEAAEAGDGEMEEGRERGREEAERTGKGEKAGKARKSNRAKSRNPFSALEPVMRYASKMSGRGCYASVLINGLSIFFSALFRPDVVAQHMYSTGFDRGMSGLVAAVNLQTEDALFARAWRSAEVLLATALAPPEEDLSGADGGKGSQQGVLPASAGSAGASTGASVDAGAGGDTNAGIGAPTAASAPASPTAHVHLDILCSALKPLFDAILAAARSSMPRSLAQIPSRLASLAISYLPLELAMKYFDCGIPGLSFKPADQLQEVPDSWLVSLYARCNGGSLAWYYQNVFSQGIQTVLTSPALGEAARSLILTQIWALLEAVCSRPALEDFAGYGQGKPPRPINGLMGKLYEVICRHQEQSFTQLSLRGLVALLKYFQANANLLAPDSDALLYVRNKFCTSMLAPVFDLLIAPERQPVVEANLELYKRFVAGLMSLAPAQAFSNVFGNLLRCIVKATDPVQRQRYFDLFSTLVTRQALEGAGGFRGNEVDAQSCETLFVFSERAVQGADESDGRHGYRLLEFLAMTSPANADRVLALLQADQARLGSPECPDELRAVAASLLKERLGALQAATWGLSGELRESLQGVRVLEAVAPFVPDILLGHRDPSARNRQSSVRFAYQLVEAACSPAFARRDIAGAQGLLEQALGLFSAGLQSQNAVIVSSTLSMMCVLLFSFTVLSRGVLEAGLAELLAANDAQTVQLLNTLHPRFSDLAGRAVELLAGAGPETPPFAIKACFSVISVFAASAGPMELNASAERILEVIYPFFAAERNSPHRTLIKHTLISMGACLGYDYMAETLRGVATAHAERLMMKELEAAPGRDVVALRREVQEETASGRHMISAALSAIRRATPSQMIGRYSAVDYLELGLPVPENVFAWWRARGSSGEAEDLEEIYDHLFGVQARLEAAARRSQPRPREEGETVPGQPRRQVRGAVWGEEALADGASGVRGPRDTRGARISAGGRADPYTGREDADGIEEDAVDDQMRDARENRGPLSSQRVLQAALVRVEDESLVPLRARDAIAARQEAPLDPEEERSAQILQRNLELLRRLEQRRSGVSSRFASVGIEYLNRRGGGDVQRRGQRDPFAYLPLSAGARLRKEDRRRLEEGVANAMSGLTRGKKMERGMDLPRAQRRALKKHVAGAGGVGDASDAKALASTREMREMRATRGGGSTRAAKAARAGEKAGAGSKALGPQKESFKRKGGPRGSGSKR